MTRCRQMTVSSSYEPVRVGRNCLVDAYSQIAPVHKRAMRPKGTASINEYAQSASQSNPFGGHRHESDSSSALCSRVVG